MSLNLSKINPDDFYSDLVDKLNSNFETIGKSNGGPVGPRGFPGSVGLPGPRGPVGERGIQGVRGNKWFAANNRSKFPISDVIDGDYTIDKSTGEFYQFITNDWVKVGTFNFSEGLTIDREEITYNSDYEDYGSALKTLINSKTNYNLLLSNMDRPDPDLGVQIPNADSAGHTYPLVQGDSDSYSYLYDYKLRVFSSGNSEDDSQQIFGRNLHLANSFAMTTKAGWLKASGFTVSSDLDNNSINSGSEGVEILRIDPVNSGSSGHGHRAEFRNMDFWASSLRVTRGGKASIGFNDNYTPKQVFDVNGAVLIGDSDSFHPGSIRYRSDSFEGYNGTGWVRLDITIQDLINTLSADIDAFVDRVIRTDGSGGVVLGDMSVESTPSAGSIRYNNTTSNFEGFNGTEWLVLNNLLLPGDNGDGFTDADGNPISSKITVNSDGTNNPGPVIYEGIIFTSEDNSIDISQDVIDSKYAKIKLSSVGSLGTTDSKGNPVAVNSIDIESNDIDVSKTMDGGKMTFDLKIASSDKFKSSVNSSIDIRSSDGSVVATPPNDNNDFWDIKVGGGSGSGASASAAELLKDLSKYQISSNRYKSTDDVSLDLSYSSSSGGLYTKIPFTEKSFDENCNVSSTDPFEVTITEKNNGIYHVSSRVRFSYTEKPTGSTWIRLVVMKSGTIVSTLQEVNALDLTGSINETTQYELQGSDDIDLSCMSGECESTLSLAIVAEGSSGHTGSINFLDGSVAIHKIVSVSSDIIKSSNIAFKSLNFIDNDDELIGTTLSEEVNANVWIKTGALLSTEHDGSNVFTIDINTQALADHIDANVDTGFKNIGIGGFTLSSSNVSTFNIEAGDGLDVALSGSNIVISTSSGSTTRPDYYIGESLLSASHSGNVVIGSGLSADTGQAGLNIQVDPDFFTPVPSLHLHTDYEKFLPSQSPGSINKVSDGAFNYRDFTISQDSIAAIRQDVSDEQFINADMGSITDSSFPGSVVYTVPDSGVYEISLTSSVGVKYVNDSIRSSDLQVIEKAVMNSVMVRLDSGSDYSFIGSNHNSSCGVPKIISSSEMDIKLGRIATHTAFDMMRENLSTFSGSVILELEKDQKYGFGITSGLNPSSLNILTKSGSSITIKTVNPDSDIKVLLSSVDINIKRLR